MGKDSRGESLVFDDRTQLSLEEATEPPDGPEAPDHATVIDEALGEQVAGRLRALRHHLTRRPRDEDAEKTAFVEAPHFDDDDDEDDSADQPTAFETQLMPAVTGVPRLGEETPDDDFELPPVAAPVPPTSDNPDRTAVDLSFEQVEALLKPQRSYAEPLLRDGSDATLEDSDQYGGREAYEYTVRAEIPLEEPELPSPIDRDANVEYTRKEPIPYELFFEGGEPSVENVPPSVRPPPPRIGKSKRAPEPERSTPDTLLDVAAQAGVAPEPADDADTNEAEAAVEEKPKLPLPEEDPQNVGLGLEALLEEDREVRKRPREKVGTEDIRRLAAVSSATAKVIPLVMGIFVVVATLIIGLKLFRASGPPKTQHVELRFLTTHRGKQTQVFTSEGAPTARVSIETTPADVLVVHNRQILGKTPITVDLPIDLGKEIGVELSGPYYETWISQVPRDATTEEYRIKAELIAK